MTQLTTEASAAQGTASSDVAAPDPTVARYEASTLADILAVFVDDRSRAVEPPPNFHPEKDLERIKAAVAATDMMETAALVNQHATTQLLGLTPLSDLIGRIDQELGFIGLATDRAGIDVLVLLAWRDSMLASDPDLLIRACDNPWTSRLEYAAGLVRLADSTDQLIRMTAQANTGSSRNAVTVANHGVRRSYGHLR